MFSLPATQYCVCAKVRYLSSFSLPTCVYNFSLSLNQFRGFLRVERKTSTTSLPETNGSENAITGEPGKEERGDRSRSTWGGRESHPRPSQKKPKRVTDLAPRGRRRELDYPQPLRNYNIHEQGLENQSPCFILVPHHEYPYRYGLEPPYRLRTSSEVNSAPSTRTSSFSEGGLEENGQFCFS